MGMIKKLDYKPPSRPIKPLGMFNFFTGYKGFMFLGFVGLTAAFFNYSGIMKKFRK